MCIFIYLFLKNDKICEPKRKRKWAAEVATIIEQKYKKRELSIFQMKNRVSELRGFFLLFVSKRQLDVKNDLNIKN